MTDQTELSQIERRVTEAFQAHADSVQPSPAAYARLAEVVNAGSASRGGWNLIGYIRPLGFVAAAVAAIGMSGYVLSVRGQQAVETAVESPAAFGSGAVANDRAAGTGPANDLEIAEPAASASRSNPEAYRADGAGAELADDVKRADGSAADGGGIEVDLQKRFADMTYAPVGSTPREAAENFLDLLGLGGPELAVIAGEEFEASSGAHLVEVHRPSQSGEDQGSLLTRLVVLPIGESYIVDEARSGTYDFTFVGATDDDPTADDHYDDVVVLNERVDVELLDPRERPVAISLKPVIKTSRSIAVQEGVSLDDQSAALVGTSRVWVVVGDGSATTGMFSAKSAYYVGADDPSNYTVVGLPPSDPDGGLVIRAEPAGKQIGVIPLGSSGISRRNVAPRYVGRNVWWAISTSDGTEGWVASDYLLPSDQVDNAALLDLVQRLVGSTSDFQGDVVDLTFAYPVYVGSINQPQLIERGLEDPAQWVSPRTFRGGTEQPDQSLHDFYQLERWADAEIIVPSGYLNPGTERVVNAYFGDLPSVALELVNPSTGAIERIHVFVSVHDRDLGGLTSQQLSIFGIVLEAEPRESADADDQQDPVGPAVQPDPDGEPNPDGRSDP